MNDTLKILVLAAVTAAVVQVLLAPFVHQFYGYPTGPAEVPVAAAVGQAAGSPAPPPSEAPTRAEQPTAPNIQGMKVDAARERFRAQGIVVIEDGAREDDSVEPGTILQQRPLPGAPMPVKELRVIVATAPAGLEVPGVVGRPQDEAKAALEQRGFTVQVDRAPAPDAAPGTVVDQQPPEGARVPKGGKVRIVVAEVATVKVPKVTRKKLPKARQILEEAGLAVGRVREVEDPELGGGTVLRQTPKPGAEVAPGTEVELTVVAPD
ncbi:MAG: PASTA domain-containing protein [Deltaproteobacteria bacterium]|nr:MAG: PASTA domain-containing protein [Deltaproteobacteria bacterium]